MSENAGALRIVTFDPRYLPAFISLNREWIERYFRIEANDVRQLEDAENIILKAGGEILFVVDAEGNAIGTCAMVPHGPGCFELAKMAVAPAARGRGVGDLLMKACLDWARQKGASSVMLLSNTILEPAITLYKKHGFHTVNLGPHPDYERCNIEMRINLKLAP